MQPTYTGTTLTDVDHMHTAVSSTHNIAPNAWNKPFYCRRNSNVWEMCGRNRRRDRVSGFHWWWILPVRCFFCCPCPVGQFDHNLLLESCIKSLLRHRCQPPLFQGRSEIANPSDYARGAIWPGQPGPEEEMTKTHESNQHICCTEGGQPDYVSLF